MFSQNQILFNPSDSTQLVSNSSTQVLFYNWVGIIYLCYWFTISVVFVYNNEFCCSGKRTSGILGSWNYWQGWQKILSVCCCEGFFSAFGIDLLQICPHSDIQYGARHPEPVHLPLRQCAGSYSHLSWKYSSLGQADWVCLLSAHSEESHKTCASPEGNDHCIDSDWQVFMTHRYSIWQICALGFFQINPNKVIVVMIW